MMHRLSKRIKDKAVLRLIRRYLQAGVMDNRVVMERYEGTPQGGPLSPLLANVLLDEVDRELERRGHRFVRYADDCDVYTRSQKAGERVLRGMRRLYDRLHLKVNEAKTAVTSAFGVKFLGYSLWLNPWGNVRRAVAAPAIKAFKRRIRQITRRPRLVRNRQGELFVSFTPAISPRSAKRIRQQVRCWRLHFRISRSLDDLARAVNPIIRGWIHYYGAFQRSSLLPVLQHIDRHLVKWVKWKYKKKRLYSKRARCWLGQVARYRPGLLAHWRLGAPFPAV